MTTARIFCGLLWLCLGLSVQAADDKSGADMARERARIDQQRELLESNFSKVQRGCYARFAVSDCLIHARRERRIGLDELRRQEVVLNNLDRQAMAQAELDRIGRNTSPERQQELTEQRQQALENAQQRQARSEQKESAVPESAAAAVSGVPSARPAANPADGLRQQ